MSGHAQNQFYVTLLSDSSMEYFPNNCQCCFNVKLPTPIAINKQDWEVALVEVILPSNVKNISEDETEFEARVNNMTMIAALKKNPEKYPPYHETSDGLLVYPLNIDAGYYASPKTFDQRNQIRICRTLW